jgi:LysM repeat protein
MIAPVNCYTCEQPAVNACRRCAQPYCEDHGNASYCAGCLQPSSALPSFNLYRGALLTMLVGTAVAIILIVRPPGASTGASPVFVGKLTPTATAAGGAAQATVPAVTPATTGTPGEGTATAEASGSETPGAEGTPTATGTASPFNEYVVVEGDTLFGIAQANLAPGDDIVAFAQAIAALNGLDYDNPDLPIGKILLLPKPPEPSATSTPTP